MLAGVRSGKLLGRSWIEPERTLVNDDMPAHAISEIASGSQLGIDATKKLPGEGFKGPWPPLIKMDSAVKAKVETLFGDNR